ncbi:MAG: UDP-N-acetylenolpyruvoylglucosamine reductase [Beggiatoa sp. IS2]|nr:MAG: UDP-N-acetylenolpyruvoylglucosamine reductase [Beggiatoa sp. IS2]
MNKITGLQGHLRHNEPLAKHTTWHVGGPADWFYEPANVLDLAHFLKQVPADTPLFWVGIGSNLLVRDGGIRGIVVLTAGLLKEITVIDEKTLHLEAGVACPKIAHFAAHHGLSSAEFLAGIPGTLGGALAMNAGAFGGDIWSIVRGVEVLDRYGQHHRRSATDYQIAYRSVKKPTDEWFVGATLELTPASPESVHAKIQKLLQKRHETQPIGLPSCGSVFRNPPGDYAARLIEHCGWKGRGVGGACVSTKHANFIINTGGATATDIEKLIAQIQESVAETFGIRLIPEVCIVGDKLGS